MKDFKKRYHWILSSWHFLSKSESCVELALARSSHSSLAVLQSVSAEVVLAKLAVHVSFAVLQSVRVVVVLAKLAAHVPFAVLQSERLWWL